MASLESFPEKLQNNFQYGCFISYTIDSLVFFEELNLTSLGSENKLQV